MHITDSIKWRLAQWLELRWWKNYLNDKEKTNYLHWKRNYWELLLSRMNGELKLTASSTVCDLGCGPAGVFVALPDNKVVSVDPLIDEYEKEIPVFSKADYQNTVFVNSPMEDFETTQKFDIVFCMNCINHVRDIGRGFRKLKEVCAENGAVIVSVDAHNFSFFKYLFRLVPGDALHPHQYNLGEYKLFFEKQGMEILKMEVVKKEFFFNHYLMIAKRNKN